MMYHISSLTAAMVTSHPGVSGMQNTGGGAVLDETGPERGLTPGQEGLDHLQENK